MAGEAAKDRGRRTQAERTAETRGRIVAAVVESIAEIGFQRTTASEIAQRSGVTWGAVQHHFGGKDGILAAVLEDSFARFERRLADVPPARSGTPLEERVSRFVDGAWQHFESAPYRSTFEILLNHAGREREAADASWQDGMFRAWNRVWGEVFDDAPLSRRQSLALQHYTISVLSGLAALKAMEGAGARTRTPELGYLKDTLVRELGRR